MKENFTCVSQSIQILFRTAELFKHYFEEVATTDSIYQFHMQR